VTDDGNFQSVCQNVSEITLIGNVKCRIYLMWYWKF